MKRKQAERIWKAYEYPRESELRAVRVQSRLAYFSCGCVVLMAICLYLWGRGFPTTPVPEMLFLLLCISVSAHIISVFRNGFFARGGCLVRGGYGVFQALLRLGGILIVGILFLWIISN